MKILDENPNVTKKQYENIRNRILKMHTPGKWSVISKEYSHYIDVYSQINEAGGIEICRLDETIKESLANAKRIVQMNNSFDDLLEACKKASEYVYYGGNSTDVGKALESAIAKVEGE